MFEMLDKLNKDHPIDDVKFYVPANLPKSVGHKYTDFKEYQRQYYLINIERYKQHNTAYRQRMKELKLGMT